MSDTLSLSILAAASPPLPPAYRSPITNWLTAAAALGRFELQQCDECDTVQYPPREVCGNCLGSDLAWQQQSGSGELLATTTLHHVHDEYFNSLAPWRLGLVHLDCGPSVVTYIHPAISQAPNKVDVHARLDKAGRAVLIACTQGANPNMSNDPQMREFGCDPAQRCILITDGESSSGQALAHAFAEAGAAKIWLGTKSATTERDLGNTEIQSCIIDLADRASLQKAAALTSDVQIVVNNSQAPAASDERSGEQAGEQSVDEMQTNYYGLVSLAETFGAAIVARAGDAAPPVAWVNLLSIFALTNHPELAGFSASQAAARSYSQALRAQLLRSGIRLLNVFPGPIDNDTYRGIAGNKLSPAELAKHMVQGLRDGVEDIYPGEIAQSVLAKLNANPKLLEKELSDV